MPDAGAREPRGTVRKTMRARRRSLAPFERRMLERAIVRNILSWPPYRRARHIAVFLAFDGEPSLGRLIETAHRQHKRLYVPTLAGKQMTFVRLLPKAAFGVNFFGILEPSKRETIDARRLDLVLTPLVACDDAGTRLGVGRGYYDRCFAFLRERRAWIRPKLAGIAYDFQRLPHIDVQPWDIPLWGVVTERQARTFPRRPSS